MRRADAEGKVAGGHAPLLTAGWPTDVRRRAGEKFQQARLHGGRHLPTGADITDTEEWGRKRQLTQRGSLTRHGRSGAFACVSDRDVTLTLSVRWWRGKKRLRERESEEGSEEEEGKGVGWGVGGVLGSQRCGERL